MQTKLPSTARARVRAQRIPLDRRHFEALLGKADRVAEFRMHVETNAWGETIAYLERQETHATPASRLEHSAAA